MTQHVTNPSDVQIAEFIWSLPEEEQAKFNLETPEGLSAAMEAYHASMTGEGADQKKERKEREAKEYTVAILEMAGGEHFLGTVVGSGFGSVGRESNDPVKWSDARKLRSRAEIRAHKMRKEGKNVHVLVLPTEEYLGKFLG